MEEIQKKQTEVLNEILHLFSEECYKKDSQYYHRLK